MLKAPKIFQTVVVMMCSSTGEGMTLEICPGNEDGSRIDGSAFPLATILADDEQRLWMEIYTGDGPVRVPVSEIERALERAKLEVRPEVWYDRKQ
jgi:hypothetical protein